MSLDAAGQRSPSSSGPAASPSRRRAVRKRRATKPAPTVDVALVKALARVLAKATAPLSVAAMQAQLARALFRVPDAKVLDALAGMVAGGHAVVVDGAWSLGATPLPAPPVPSPAPALKSAEGLAPSTPPPPPAPPTREEIMAARRFKLRIVTPCEGPALERLTAERDAVLAQADALYMRGKNLAREAKTRTKWIRQGFTVSTVAAVARVKDLSRGLLVTFDVSGAEPVELKSSKLAVGGRAPGRPRREAVATKGG